MERAHTVAFVAGATGYTGREVVAELRRRDIDTVAHLRPDSRRCEHWRGHFAELEARVDESPWQLEAMTAALRASAPSMLFCCIGTTRARGREASDERPETYETVDYGLTQLLLDAARNAELSACRFVYLSSMGADDKSRSAYLAWRFRAEAAVRDSGLDFVIARPSFISGPDRDEARPLERLGAGLSDGALALAGALGARRLRDRYQSISSSELARALVSAALDPATTRSTLQADALRGAGS